MNNFEIAETNFPICPSCKSKNAALIFWGYPGDMEWYLNAVAKKEIVLGGCTLSNNDPKWECIDYSLRWGKRDE